MDVILLAAGKGTRMRPLTDNTPKPLLNVQQRPIMEWTLLAVAPVAERVIVVAGYLKEQIEAYMAQQTIISDYVIVEQLPEPMGTGHAVQVCQPYLTGDDFLVLNGDDLYAPADLRRMADEPAAILAVERDDPTRWGVIVQDENGMLVRMHEKPEAGVYTPPVPINIGACKLTREIFDYEIQLSQRGEYELTDYMTYLAERRGMRVIVTDFWQPVGTPDDLAHAQTITMPQ